MGITTYAVFVSWLNAPPKGAHDSMVRISARKRDDGRFEAEGVVFDPLRFAWGAIGHAKTSAILRRRRRPL
jgi:hypothetical protein